MYIERHKRNGCKILVYSLPREALPFLNYLYQDAKTKKCVCVRERERKKEGGRVKWIYIVFEWHLPSPI